MEINTYGKLEIETKAKDSKLARDITKTVLEFGVTQQQILHVAYLLSLELENREAMVEISSCIKQFLESLNDDEESINSSKILTT